MSRSRLLKHSRKAHYWAALACAVPILIITVTVLLLLLKKDFDWIQPPSQRGALTVPSLSFSQVLSQAQSVELAQVNSWSDIKRLDVRPSKGLIKVRTNNGWEIQLDAASGEVLQSAYRRTDLIESIHDGSFFHDLAKHWLFLPASILLLLLNITGIYMASKRWMADQKHTRQRRRLSKRPAL